MTPVSEDSNSLAYAEKVEAGVKSMMAEGETREYGSSDLRKSCEKDV
jgi:hypothetical protein